MCGVGGYLYSEVQVELVWTCRGVGGKGDRSAVRCQGLCSKVPCLELFLNGEVSAPEQNDRHDWKHYFLATSLAGGKKSNIFLQVVNNSTINKFFFRSFLVMPNIYFLGYDISYYFLGRMGFVVYVKNNFLQKIGKWSLHSLQLMQFDPPFRESP